MLGEKKEIKSSICLQHVHQRILSSRFELKGHYSYFRHISLNIEDMQGKSLGEKNLLEWQRPGENCLRKSEAHTAILLTDLTPMQKHQNVFLLLRKRRL